MPPAPSNRARLVHFFGVLGPGLITGAADDDPSGISTYSVAGATRSVSMPTGVSQRGPASFHEKSGRCSFLTIMRASSLGNAISVLKISCGPTGGRHAAMEVVRCARERPCCRVGSVVDGAGG